MAEVLFKPHLPVVKARQLFITAADREACKHNACVMQSVIESKSPNNPTLDLNNTHSSRRE